MYFWSETPHEEMWNQIRYLKSPKNVENLLNGTINSKRTIIHNDSEMLEKTSYEIASCIRQADEYYKASNTVGLVTQPLLQFYGAQSLAKAVILSNNPDKNLSDFKYHGLHSKPSLASDAEKRGQLQDYINNPTEWNIEKEFSITNDGVFRDLCKSIGDVDPGKGTILFFKELIRNIPDLSQKYLRHYNQPSNCFYLESGRYSPKTQNGDIYTICFGGYENIDNIKEVFPEFKTNPFKQEDYRTEKGLITCFGSRDITIGKIVKGTVAGKYFVRPLDCGIYKSFSVIFAALHVLSNIVRYKPAFWMHQIDGEISGSVSIVEDFCNLAKRRLPNDALESLWNEDFIYGTPGYSP